jgi:hypothetical protein
MESSPRRHPGPSGYPLFWTELDTGGGLWENVPDVIRAGFRVLLDLTDSLRDANVALSQSTMQRLAASDEGVAELRTEHSRIDQSLQSSHAAVADTNNRLRNVAADVSSVGQRVQEINRQVSE